MLLCPVFYARHKIAHAAYIFWRTKRRSTKDVIFLARIVAEMSSDWERTLERTAGHLRDVRTR